MTDCIIVDYTPDLRIHFEQCNREWLEADFSVEPIDEELFANPETLILGKGGYICFASRHGEIVGTAALIKVDTTTFELAKMGVIKTARGVGIGELLARHCIKKAQALGSKKLILMSNTKLDAAIQLYEKLGFAVTSRGEHPKYNRCNICMEMVFSCH